MGIYVRLNILPDRIDEERWEAVWLTSMQLLERFPGPLAAYRCDDGHQGRFLNSPRILFDVGTPEERWRVEGDLSSSRFAETYQLWRHLAHYRKQARQWPDAGTETSRDILWLLHDDEYSAGMAGLDVFDAKSQGYPFHYAMLAVGMLIEDAFPGAAVVSGDINRTQAERAGPWIESVLGRRLRLPVVTEGGRLLSRLVKAYDGQIGPAIDRFRHLYRDRSDSTWMFLMRMEDGPDFVAVRKAFLSELGRYRGLRQRGAEELVAALCDSGGGLDRVFEWLCGPSSTGPSGSYDPEELLECLCDLLIPIPPEERSVVEGLTPPSDQLPSVDSQLFHAFSAMMGKPVACAFHVDEDELAGAFSARWPDRAETFRRRLRERVAKARESLEGCREGLDRRIASAEARARELVEKDPDFGSFSPPAEYEPAAEFLYDEIARQKRRPPGMPDFAREVGKQMRKGLKSNARFRKELYAFDRQDLIGQISLASRKHEFVLSESAWERIDRATTDDLRNLVPLALMDHREIRFWEARLCLLESPELWPLLAEDESSDPS